MAVAFLPFNLFVYTHLTYGNKENAQGESIIQTLDFETMFISLSVVLSAILLGLYTGYRYDGQLAHERANRLGSICGLLLVITSVFMSSGGDDSKSRLWNQPGTFYMAVAAPCLAGLFISTLLARTVVRLSKPESVTIAIECCYQNTGIATSVAITMFANADERAQAVAVPLFYGFVEAVVCGLYCVYMWKMGVRSTTVVIVVCCGCGIDVVGVSCWFMYTLTVY
jgi:predicted Na+-dependent transporter